MALGHWGMAQAFSLHPDCTYYGKARKVCSMAEALETSNAMIQSAGSLRAPGTAQARLRS